jgi:Tfp pilus assembly protein PilZ
MTEGKENRSFDRRALFAEIRYLSNSPELSARISDISVGGLFVDTVNALDLGAEVKFKLILPGSGGGREIEGEGKVTWRQETVGMGIQYTRMRRDDWEAIRSYISSREE